MIGDIVHYVAQNKRHCAAVVVDHAGTRVDLLVFRYRLDMSNELHVLRPYDEEEFAPGTWHRKKDCHLYYNGDCECSGIVAASVREAEWLATEKPHCEVQILAAHIMRER